MRGCELLNVLQLQADMRLHADTRRTHRMESQESAVHPFLQVDADRAHVAHDLRGRFLEREIQAALAAPAGRIDEMRREAGLAGAGRARHQHRCCRGRSPAAQHVVELGDAGRDALLGRIVVERDGRDRQDRDAALVDQERILVRAVGRAAILDDAQPPGRRSDRRRGGRAGSRSPRRTPRGHGASACPRRARR